MKKNIIEELALHDIHRYGSTELLIFEKRMERYFEREYDRWRGNNELPEKYGISSFKGDIAKQETHIESIQHYDKDFKIYKAFLDKKYMVYTMAYYGATEYLPEINNEITLEQAQVNKYNLIIKRADIKDGDRVLELGCGFGGFTSYLLEKLPNVHVTGINPSTVQSSYLKEKLSSKDNAFSNKNFTLIQKYFDDITEGDIADSSFDKVVSIGVLEAVTNLEKLFQFVSRVLKPGGKTFHHFIVSKYTIPQFLNAENTLMVDYFPGGHIWPFPEAMRHDRYLTPVNSWFVNGLNYWKTLDDWHKRFWNSIDELYPHYLTLEDVEGWNKYFSLCKAMFIPNNGNSYGNGHYLFEKPLNKPRLKKIK